MNGGTFIVVLLLSFAVLGAVLMILKNRNNGKSIQCGADCSHCTMACAKKERFELEEEEREHRASPQVEGKSVSS